MNTPDDVLRDAYLRYQLQELSRADLRHVIQFLETLNEARGLLLVGLAVVLAGLEREAEHTQTVAAIFERLPTLPLASDINLERAQTMHSQLVYPEWLSHLDAVRAELQSRLEEP